jgi:hypothetical protein
MIDRPCLRNLDRAIVALWGLEPVDLFAIIGVVALGMVVSNIAIALVAGLFVCLGLKALKAGKPRGYVFYLFYRAGVLRLWPATLRPPYLVIPPAFGKRSLSFSAAPGPEDDETEEARYFRGRKDYVR